MNLFEELQGRAGEELTSATLRFLILRSQKLRETFMNMVSRQSQQGPIVMHEEFACRLEVPSKENENQPDQPTRKAGRIDIVIQTDNAIIGIENKLDAVFQPGQPQKYLFELEQLAKSLGNKQKKYLLVILAPSDRNAEIKKQITHYADTSHYIQLDWEKVLEELNRVQLTDSDSMSKIIIDQLTNYIVNNRRIWPNGLFASHLRGVFDPKGVHGEFIRKLTLILPSSGRIGTGHKTIGFHLDVSGLTDSSDGLDRAWFGFVRCDLLQDPREGTETELILATTFAPNGVLPSGLRAVHLKNAWWEKQMHTMAVDYDDDLPWKQSYTWSNLFKSLFRT